MKYGIVTGSLWSTRKDTKLQGFKFMLVDIINTHTGQVEETLVAADNAGAGIGDEVLVTQGTAARISAEKTDVPIDAMIVGIVDSMENG